MRLTHLMFPLPPSGVVKTAYKLYLNVLVKNSNRRRRGVGWRKNGRLSSPVFYSFTFNCLRSFKIQSLASHTNKNTRDDIFLLRLPPNSATTLQLGSAIDTTSHDYFTFVSYVHTTRNDYSWAFDSATILATFDSNRYLLPKLFWGFALALSWHFREWGSKYFSCRNFSSL